MSIKLTVNGTTITIDQTTDGNTTINVDTTEEPTGCCRIGPVTTDTEPLGPTFNSEQLARLREVIRAISYGVMDLSPAEGSSKDRDRGARDRKLHEKFHLEKNALGCLRRLVGDNFYDNALRNFNI